MAKRKLHGDHRETSAEIRLIPVYEGSTSLKTSQKGSDLSDSTSEHARYFSLPLELGRVALCNAWWKGCPNKCQAMDPKSSILPCKEYCWRVRRKRNRDSLSRSMIAVDSQGRLTVIARHKETVRIRPIIQNKQENSLEHVGGEFNSRSYEVCVGISKESKPKDSYWMKFRLDTRRTCTSLKRQSTRRQDWMDCLPSHSLRRKRYEATRRDILSLDEDIVDGEERCQSMKPSAAAPTSPLILPFDSLTKRKLFTQEEEEDDLIESPDVSFEKYNVKLSARKDSVDYMDSNKSSKTDMVSVTKASKKHVTPDHPSELQSQKDIPSQTGQSAVLSVALCSEAKGRDESAVDPQRPRSQTRGRANKVVTVDQLQSIAKDCSQGRLERKTSGAVGTRNVDKDAQNVRRRIRRRTFSPSTRRLDFGQERERNVRDDQSSLSESILSLPSGGDSGWGTSSQFHSFVQESVELHCYKDALSTRKSRSKSSHVARSAPSPSHPLCRNLMRKEWTEELSRITASDSSFRAHMIRRVVTMNQKSDGRYLIFPALLDKDTMLQTSHVTSTRRKINDRR